MIAHLLYLINNLHHGVINVIFSTGKPLLENEFDECKKAELDPERFTDNFFGVVTNLEIGI
jgi:hypothetical protein